MADRPADTPTLVGLRTTGAVAIAAVWTLAEAARAVVTGAAAREPGWWAVSILVMVVCTGLLLRASADPMPARRAVLVAFLPAVGALATIAMTGGPDPTGLYGAWTWPTGTIVLCFLILCGRTVLAWAGEVALSAVVLGWWFLAPVESNVTGVWPELNWNLSFLGTCTVLGVAMRHQVKVINELRSTTASVSLAHQLAEARTAERDRQLLYLNATARPLLEQIARADALDDDDRKEIMLVEAQLRDRIRARGLASEDLLAAAREARARGVSVILLDDGGLDDVTETAREATRKRIAAVLRSALEDATAPSTVTARISPPGRSTLATVLHLSDKGVRRQEIGKEPSAPHLDERGGLTARGR